MFLCGYFGSDMMLSAYRIPYTDAFFTYLSCSSSMDQVPKRKTSSTDAERPQKRGPAVPQVLSEGGGSINQHPVTQTRGL